MFKVVSLTMAIVLEDFEQNWNQRNPGMVLFVSETNRNNTISYTAEVSYLARTLLQRHGTVEGYHSINDLIEWLNGDMNGDLIYNSVHHSYRIQCVPFGTV